MRNAPDTDLCRSQRTPATIPIRLVVDSEGFRVEHEASTVDLSVQGIKVRAPLALFRFFGHPARYVRPHRRSLGSHIERLD
jgi:hypothetical protein